MTDKPVTAFGGNYVFHQIPYTGSSVSVSVDQTAVVAQTVSPSGGPSASLGSASSGLKTLTLAANGSDDGGYVIVVTTHGKSIASYKP